MIGLIETHALAHGASVICFTLAPSGMAGNFPRF
jgi:hypothetical protein